MKILAYPKSGIPYNEALYSEVEKTGAIVDEGEFSGRWIWKNLFHYDVIHIHWPSFFYRSRDSKQEEIKNFIKFLLFMLWIRLLGKKLFWTAHNLYPHDAALTPGLDKLARILVMRFSTRIFIHGNAAKKQFIGVFPSSEKKISLVEHGHWIDYYPDTVDRSAAREDLNIIEGSFVFLFFGLCKEYKNIHGLVDSFSCTKKDNDLLIIAGKFAENEYRHKIDQQIKAQRQESIRIDARFIPDDEVQLYMHSADIVVLPYERTLTSGAAILAFSFGRPVVAPRLGSLIDIVTDETGVLYDPADPQGLSKAMELSREIVFDQHRILSIAKTMTWNSAVNALVT